MRLIFICGGVRSGKSAFAEKMLQANAKGRALYLASGVAVDGEMQARIARHRADRANANWQTIEEPLAVAKVLTECVMTHDSVLWDCLTTWLSNVQYAGFGKGEETPNKARIIEEINRIKHALQMLQASDITLYIVSNELLDEPGYASDEVNFYRQSLGELHQWLVVHADEAYELTEGIARRWR